jgi:hypothetical protein
MTGAPVKAVTGNRLMGNMIMIMMAVIRHVGKGARPRSGGWKSIVDRRALGAVLLRARGALALRLAAERQEQRTRH